MSGPYFSERGFDLSFESTIDGKPRVMLDGFDVTTALLSIKVELHAGDMAKVTIEGLLSGFSTTADAAEAFKDTQAPVTIERSHDPGYIEHQNDPDQRWQR